MRNQTVVPNSTGYLREVPGDVIRGPVEGEIHIESTVAASCGTIYSLIRHEVNEVIGTTSLTGHDIRECARINGGAELVGTRIGLSSHGGRRIHKKARLSGNHGRVLELEVRAAGIITQLISIAGENSGLDIKMAGGNVSDFSRRRAGGGERLIVRSDEIPQSVPQRLHDVGFTVLLHPVRVQSSELADAEEDFIMGERLLEPPGIEAHEIEAGVAAGIGNGTDIGTQVAARL